MAFQKVIKTTIFYGVIFLNFMVKAYANDTKIEDLSIAPLKMNNESSLILTQNAYSEVHNQIWYSILDTSLNSNDDKEFSLSIIKYLDKDYALDEFKKLVTSKNIKMALSLNNGVEFCGYRVQKLKGMVEDSLFVYLGIDGKYFMMMGRKALVFKAFNMNKYCEITIEN